MNHRFLTAARCQIVCYIVRSATLFGVLHCTVCHIVRWAILAFRQLAAGLGKCRQGKSEQFKTGYLSWGGSQRPPHSQSSPITIVASTTSRLHHHPSSSSQSPSPVLLTQHVAAAAVTRGAAERPWLTMTPGTCGTCRGEAQNPYVPLSLQLPYKTRCAAAATPK